MVYTIGCGHSNQLLGVSHGNRWYVVAFPDKNVATIVQNKISIPPRLYLQRSPKTEDISAEVFPQLKAMGIELNDNLYHEIIVDTDAQLTIMKNNDEDNDNMSLLHSVIMSVPDNDFYMYPFNTNVGVIIQRELVSEDEDKYVFSSHIVDPCDLAYAAFLKGLK